MRSPNKASVASMEMEKSGEAQTTSTITVGSPSSSPRLVPSLLAVMDMGA